MRRLRKQPVAAFNPWDFEREIGDRVYSLQACCGDYHILDLVESRGRHKSAAGILSTRLVKKNGRARLAIRDDQGTWYWAT